MKVRRNNLFAADGTNEIRKRISLVLYYNSDVRSEPMDFREVFLQNQALEGITLSMLMLGDIVISVETATRQADERGHKLIDEIRVLMVNTWVVHLLGFDHEISEEAEVEMEKEELLLKSLGWKGK
ncbi:unnamed protein product [Malus baccata var. baccata]